VRFTETFGDASKHNEVSDDSSLRRYGSAVVVTLLIWRHTSQMVPYFKKAFIRTGVELSSLATALDQSWFASSWVRPRVVRGAILLSPPSRGGYTLRCV
jgi:hypothetical protein